MSQQSQSKSTEEYVLVRKDQFDSKSAVQTAAAPDMKMVKNIRSSMKGAKRQGNTLSVNAKLVTLVNFTSAANTTQFPVLPLVVSGFQDFAGFGGVYDEYRVKSFEFHISCTPSATPTTVGRGWGAAFDPGNPGAYAIIYDVWSAQKCTGPVSMSTLLASPAPHTRTGYQVFSSGKLLPILVVGAGTMSALVGGSWVATSDNSAVHGYLKGGVDALGGAITSVLSVVVIAHTEFRMRT